MTHYWLALRTISILVAVGGAVRAGSLPEHQISLYLDVGGAVPAEPTDSWRSGFSGGVGIGADLSRAFSVILDAHYENFPASPAAHDFNDILVMIDGKLRFVTEDNPVVPYGVLGLGANFYNEQQSFLNEPPVFVNYPISGGSGVAGAFRLAGGIDIRLDIKSALFVEYGTVGFANHAYDGMGGFDWFTLNIGWKTNL